MKGMSLPIADLLSNLFYSYKFCLKDQYFKSLEKLKDVLDKPLYDFYYNFGCTCNWKKV